MPVKCEPIRIELKEDAEPYSISVARLVPIPEKVNVLSLPIPLLPKVERELERMLANGITEKVTQPTDWCALMVPVLKKNGDDEDMRRPQASKPVSKTRALHIADTRRCDTQACGVERVFEVGCHFRILADSA